MTAWHLAAALLMAQAEHDPHAGHAGHAPAPAVTVAPAADPHAGHTAAEPSAGDTPAPAVPADHAADLDYDAKAMATARAILRREHGGEAYSLVSIPILEYQSRKARGSYRWEGEAWYGGDHHRLIFKSQGEGRLGGSPEDAEVQLLYGSPVDPYWNLQAGVRQDLGGAPRQTYAVVAAEGLAPYWIEVEGSLFLSDRGDLHARVEAHYDQRITQRLILQPRLEINLAAQDVRAQSVGSGLTDAEADLRLRYEIVPELAPYIGVSHERRFGDTRRFAGAAGEGAHSTRLVIGVTGFF